MNKYKGMRTQKQYLIFSDEFPHGAIKTAEYIKKCPDFVTYVELDSSDEIEQWSRALASMQPVFKLEQLNESKPLN